MKIVRFVLPPIVFVAIILGTSLAPLACSSAKPLAADVVDCVKAEAAVITNGYSVVQVVSAVFDAIASIATGGMNAALAELATIAKQFGPDLVACIVDDYPSSGSGSGSGSGSATPPPPAQLATFKLEPSVKAQLLQQFAPGKKLDHGKAHP